MCCLIYIYSHWGCSATPLGLTGALWQLQHSDFTCFNAHKLQMRYALICPPNRSKWVLKCLSFVLFKFHLAKTVHIGNEKCVVIIISCHHIPYLQGENHYSMVKLKSGHESKIATHRIAHLRPDKCALWHIPFMPFLLTWRCDIRYALFHFILYARNQNDDQLSDQNMYHHYLRHSLKVDRLGSM